MVDEIKVEDTEVVMGLDEDESAPLLKLVAADGVTVEISRKAAALSGMLKAALENEHDVDSCPVPGVKSTALREIAAYAEHHKNGKFETIPVPLSSKDLKDAISNEFDLALALRLQAKDQLRLLYDVMLGANYLDIQPLIKLMAVVVASLIKGTPISEVAQLLDPDLGNE